MHIVKLRKIMYIVMNAQQAEERLEWLGGWLPWASSGAPSGLLQCSPLRSYRFAWQAVSFST